MVAFFQDLNVFGCPARALPTVEELGVEAFRELTDIHFAVFDAGGLTGFG